MHSYTDSFLLLTCIIGTARYTAEKATDASPTDDYSCSTYSYTGDSGFSDSRAFLQKKSPPSSPQHTSAGTERDIVLDSGASYASLIPSDVRNNEYYKSLNRECIPGMHHIRHFLISLMMVLTLQRQFTI